MKPVHQTLFGSSDAPQAERGNCFPACIASLLEIELSDVPHFYALHDKPDPDDPNRDYVNIAAFLRDRGCCIATFTWPLHPVHAVALRGTHAIFSGKSPRLEGCQHAVVGRIFGNEGWALAHDPHPSGAGIDGEPEFIEVITRFLGGAQESGLLEDLT